MLAGEGAEKFAEREGFFTSDLLTDASKKLYETWQELPEKLNVRLRRSDEDENEYIFEYSADGKTKELLRSELPQNESHDTIGLLARDKHGNISGACTTSGLAFKMHGRVGDSPIIGAGLYVDGNVGAVVATGNGELVMRACSSFHIVEMMRQGIEPEHALLEAIDRIKKDRRLTDDMQVGFLVLRRDGFWWAGSLREGFQFAAQTETMHNTLYDCTGINYTKNGLSF
jgi:N4-(beta-N-acetylglucosaminyl)-L-asparaginase